MTFDGRRHEVCESSRQSPTARHQKCGRHWLLIDCHCVPAVKIKRSRSTEPTEMPRRAWSCRIAASLALYRCHDQKFSIRCTDMSCALLMNNPSNHSKRILRTFLRVRCTQSPPWLHQ
ncbi:unnamed protein product [Cladocopium goreaui]|uniref:Uncharacterized protein n=1 Tax=Cladocopium goreaui TaxID=2562237 RepID=A0A9P1D8P7_9DINO|nr:unnamed protein product [Cladocopium goreaui]